MLYAIVIFDWLIAGVDYRQVLLCGDSLGTRWLCAHASKMTLWLSVSRQYNCGENAFLVVLFKKAFLV